MVLSELLGPGRACLHFFARGLLVRVARRRARQLHQLLEHLLRGSNAHHQLRPFAPQLVPQVRHALQEELRTPKRQRAVA